MNKALPAALIAITLPLLASCGSIVGAAIPAQTVDNPANLNSATLSSDGPFTAQAVATTIKYDTSTMVPSASFDDLTFPDLPLNLRPNSIAISATAKEMTLTGTCAMPDTIDALFRQVSLTAWNQADAANGVTVTSGTDFYIFARKTSGGTGTATYSLATNFGITFTYADAIDLLNILTTGGKNDVKVSAQVYSTLDSLAGCAVALKVGDSKATFSNFK